MTGSSDDDLPLALPPSLRASPVTTIYVPSYVESFKNNPPTNTTQLSSS